MRILNLKSAAKTIISIILTIFLKSEREDEDFIIIIAAKTMISIILTICLNSKREDKDFEHRNCCHNYYFYYCGDLSE